MNRSSAYDDPVGAAKEWLKTHPPKAPSQQFGSQPKESGFMSTARNLVGTPGRRLATETAGMMGGEALGMPLGAAAGAFLGGGPEDIPAVKAGATGGRAAGGGVGYTIADILNDYADAFANRGKYPSMGAEARKIPSDIIKGAAMQQTGERLIGPALKAAGRGFQKVAPTAVKFLANVPEKATEFLQKSGMTPRQFTKSFPGGQEEIEKLSGKAAGAFKEAQIPAKKAGQAIGKAKVALGMRGATPEEEAARIAALPKEQFKQMKFQDFNKRFSFLNKIKPGKNEDPRDFLPNAIRFKSQLQDAIHNRESSFTPSERSHLNELVEKVDEWVGNISKEYKGLENTFSAAKGVADEAANMGKKFEMPETGADALRRAAFAKTGQGLRTARAVEGVSPQTMNAVTGSATSEQFSKILPESRFGKLAMMRLPATVAGAYLGGRGSRSHPIAGAMMGAGSMLALQSPRLLAEVVTRFPMLLNNPAVRTALARLMSQGVEGVGSMLEPDR